MNYIIGEKIAALRKEKQITQTELAEYLYLTPSDYFQMGGWQRNSGNLVASENCVLLWYQY